jgi:holliday junction resolvase Hjr
MNTKKKGTDGERELIHKFWAQGWAAVRVAGSGSMRYASPDIIASNAQRRIVLECKVSKATSVYLPHKEVALLRDFAEKFQAEMYIAHKLAGGIWGFVDLDELGVTSQSFVVKKEMGRSFTDLIR